MSNYSILNRAKLSYEYLRANSTTHEFLFGAMAELVDNARDADAKNLHIYTEERDELRGKFMLCFLDDGVGMEPKEVTDVVEFGKSLKKSVDSNLIGQYGNGLKSGSMRIGNDLILFTKKNSIYTALFISITFHEGENLSDLIIPQPSFHGKTGEPYYDIDSIDGERKHRVEMETIFKYSPFKNKQQIMDQFRKIEGESGTLAIIYNLRLKDNHKPELDIHSVPYDIQMSDFRVDFEPKSQLEHKSFREYVSILYLNPHMKIYIQNKKVRTKLLDRTLYLPYKYSFMSTRFKNRAEENVQKTKKDISLAQAKLKEATSKRAHFEEQNERNNSFRKNKEYVVKLTRFRREEEHCKKTLDELEQTLKRNEKLVKEPKNLEFIFGLNIHNRCADGLFLYNCNRLIVAFEQPKVQQKNNEYRGIVGIVNVPYLVLEPTHNKQQFADSSEHKKLIDALSEHMEQYMIDIDKHLDSDFWREFGYTPNNYHELPSNDTLYLKRRIQYVKMHLQCDQCLKWRCLLWSDQLIQRDFPPDDWCCKDNNDPNRRTCDSTEALEEIKKSTFRKRVATNFQEIEKSTEKSTKMPSLSRAYIDSLYNQVTHEEPEQASISKSNKNGKKTSDWANIFNNNNKRVDETRASSSTTASSSLFATSRKSTSLNARNKDVYDHVDEEEDHSTEIYDDIDDNVEELSVAKRRKANEIKSKQKQASKKKRLNDLDTESDEEEARHQDPDFRVYPRNADTLLQPQPTTETRRKAPENNIVHIKKESVEPTRSNGQIDSSNVVNNYDYVSLTRELEESKETIELISAKFKSFLEIISRHMEEPYEQINTIKKLNANELSRYPVNDFWSKFKEYSENIKKARIDREVVLAVERERERIKSVIKNRVKDERQIQKLFELVFSNERNKENRNESV